ncbi:uncharacterized protein HMPREF1541_00329 [Cyphellophora europaea CBS 101466]|uniref:Uncharacterized protein n=1 Tax=Cyphellophora europaea (strain CBS 101466) TaxID=1220924 RepID=W2SC08_CYPE1|nr:uncharacterized protein HMPREF1541_00329 [Cyphellophora europaea CBS 101466]ETN46145.1 hypothetical protein HMPREF1541_00329 [Cyphellophora europaea CBS 101466]
MGVGKSSAINAILGHSELDTTVQTRARTSVITEFRYNHDPTCPFKAEIEAKSADEVNVVLKTLLADLLYFESIPLHERLLESEAKKPSRSAQ